MFIQINVTTGDIKQGRANQSLRSEDYSPTRMCPLALAVRRAMPGSKVSNLYISHYWNTLYRFPIDLPKRAKDFTIAFDHHEPVQPFSFYIWRDNCDYLL